MSAGDMNAFIDLIDVTPRNGSVIPSDTIVASLRAHREGNGESTNAMFQFRKIPGVEVESGMVVVSDTGRYTIINVSNGSAAYLDALVEKE